jgi:hypothetical protein
VKPDQTLDCLLELVEFYQAKIKDKSLTGSEAGILLKSLMVLGLRDASVRSRHIENISESVELMDLPFKENERILEL